MSMWMRFCCKKVPVSLDKSDGLVAKNPSGLSRIQVKEGYFSRISRIRRPKIVRVIEGPTYRSPTNRGTPVVSNPGHPWPHYNKQHGDDETLTREQKCTPQWN